MWKISLAVANRRQLPRSKIANMLLQVL